MQQDKQRTAKGGSNGASQHVKPQAQKTTAATANPPKVNRPVSARSAVQVPKSASAHPSKQQRTSRTAVASPHSGTSTSSAAHAPKRRAQHPTKQQRVEQQQKSREELNARIRTQTPSNRQAVRNEKRIKGSVKNLEIKKRSKAQKQQFRIKKKNSAITGVMILGIIIFLLAFALLFGIVSAIVAIHLHIGSGEEPSAYSIQLGDELESDYSNVITMTEEQSMRNGILYIPVSALSDMCELTVTGMTDDLRYIVRDSDSQTIRFIVGTDLAYVNECKVRMSAESFISDGKLYVPLDFFSEYSEGLTIDMDDEQKLITVYRNVTGKDEYRRDIYADFRFTLDKLETLNRITIPVDMDQSDTDDTAIDQEAE